MTARQPTPPPGNQPDERQAAETRGKHANQPAHPPASGISAAAAGGAALAAANAAGAGPAGISAGAIAGAVVGQAAQELQPQAVRGGASQARIDPATEHDYWRAHYRQRPYAGEEVPYEQLAPAYQHGWESYTRYGRTATGEPARFEDLEPQLRRDWEAQQRDRALSWEVAQQATRDAWDRVHEALLGEAEKPSAQ